jgi:hypothetical protein
MFRRTARAALIASLVASLATLASASAAGASYVRIDPHDFFIATVNGSTGQNAPVTIRMACAGPVYPGETGHPLGYQTVGVKRVPPPPAGTATLGYTGDNGTSIGAFFGPPPPTTGAGSSYVSFQVYRTKPIPIDLELPCIGSGQVIFVPLPLLPPARSIAVPVKFVGQP